MSIDLLQHVHLGAPVSALGLAFVPLFNARAEVRFEDGVDAVARGALRVSEVAVAQVPSVRVVNVGAAPVLLGEGSLLTGGLQDRVTGQPAWIAPGGEATVPVHCVERGRWGRRGGQAEEFRADRAPLALAERGAGVPRSQATTWDVVGELRRARGRRDDGGSLAELRDTASLDRRAEGLVLPWSASGAVVYWGHPGGTTWPMIVWFACASAFRGAWPSLRRVVLEAHQERCAQRGIPLRAAVAPRLSLSRVVPRLAKVAQARVESVEEIAPGVETLRLRRRGEATEMWGWATRQEGALVYLAMVRR